MFNHNGLQGTRKIFTEVEITFGNQSKPRQRARLASDLPRRGLDVAAGGGLLQLLRGAL